MKRALAIAGCLTMALAAPASAGVKVGDRAPAIEAGSWYNLPNGVNALTPTHLKGKIVMVEFWATW